MSSPSHRRQRSSQSGTPRRSNRQSESATPRNNPPQASQLVSSPLFFQSSPAPNGSQNSDAIGEVSSPLRQMSNSQSTHAQSAMPSSPLRQMTDTQSANGDGQRTPRASGMGRGTYCVDSAGLYLTHAHMQQSPRRFVIRVPALADRCANSQSFGARVVVSFWAL